MRLVLGTVCIGLGRLARSRARCEARHLAPFSTSTRFFAQHGRHHGRAFRHGVDLSVFGYGMSTLADDAHAIEGRHAQRGCLVAIGAAARAALIYVESPYPRPAPALV